MHLLDGQFPPDSEAGVAQAFARAGARTPETARALRDLGAAGAPGARSLIARELLREGAAGTERYYLDVAHYHRRQRRRRLMELACTLALGLLVSAALYRAAG